MRLQVRDFVKDMGIENIGKRLVNSREGKVEFDKPNMDLESLMKYGKLLTDEQENVRRVQLADSYFSGEASVPEAEKEEAKSSGSLLG